MEINEKIDEIIQQAKEAYQDDFSAFEQEIYDQGFRNAIYFMLWNPSERSCSNCEYRYSRELCGEEYCGQKYWSPKLEEQLWFGDICDYKDKCEHYRKVVVCPYSKMKK